MTRDTRRTAHDSGNCKEIWAIILAAGESKRMGFPKMFLEFDGITMIEKVMTNVKMSQVDNAVVVLGSERERLKELVEKTSFSHCYNDSFMDGMLSSVRCGFRHLPSNAAAVLIFQGDQPFIPAEVINQLIEAYRKSNKGIIIPVYNNKRGHPLLVANTYFKEVERLDPSDGLRGLAGRFPEDVLDLTTSEPGILRDLDTYEEYLEVINKNTEL